MANTDAPKQEAKKKAQETLMEAYERGRADAGEFIAAKVLSRLAKTTDDADI